MAYDVKKILRASLFIIAAGAALVVISMILELLALLVTGSLHDPLSLISRIYSFLMVPLFLALYFYAGFRTVRKYGLDAVSAGAVSAFSHIATGLIHLGLGTVLNILVLSRVISGLTFGSAEAALAAFFFGETTGAMGVGLPVICGIGMIIAGAIINFVIGGFGGLLALSRKR